MRDQIWEGAGDSQDRTFASLTQSNLGEAQFGSQS